MGNTHRITHEDETAAEIVKQKQEIRFEQGDFIRQIQGNLEHEYDILSPPLRKNQFYELRKIIHLRTKLAKSAFIINKYKVHTQQRELLEKQISKLKKIDNPYLIKIYELYKDSHRFYIVCEYCQGHSLSRILEDEGAISEKKTAIIMHQLLHVLNDCHDHGIIHSDLKLQNIIFNSRKQNVIKVTDFSISRIFRIQDIVDQSYRKAFLPAPETLNGQPCFKSDIWSCGIILYILWTGQLPFYGSSFKKLKQKLIHYQLFVNHERFQMISKEGKQFLQSMLRYDKAQRPTAEECLNHPWFKKYYKPPKITDMTLKRTLIECYNFNPSSKLLEATWNFYVTVIVSFEQKQSILQVFENLDSQNKGQLNQESLYFGLIRIFDENKSRFFAEFISKRQKNRGIKFSQFVSLCTNREFLINEINNKKIFNIFDEDNSGQISVSQLKAILGASKEVSEDIWIQLMKEADENADGEISFEEFHHMMNELKNVSNQSLIRNTSQTDRD